MAKPWEKAAAPQDAPRPMKPWEKAAVSSQPPAVAAPIDRPAPFSSPNPMAIAMENAQRLAAGATMPARARQDGWKPDQWAAVTRAKNGSADINDKMMLSSWESYNRELPKSSTPPMSRDSLMFEPQRQREAEDRARYENNKPGDVGARIDPLAPKGGGASNAWQDKPDIDLPPGHTFVRDNGRLFLRDPTGEKWTEEYWPGIIERGEASDWQDYYRRENANTSAAQRDKTGFEQTMSDVARGLIAPLQQSENARTAVGLPLQVGRGLYDGIRNQANNYAAVINDGRNAVRQLMDPNAEPLEAPRITYGEQNELLDPGGLLASEAGVIPYTFGQVASARMPGGKLSPLGGPLSMAAKDAFSVAATTDYRNPRMSDFVPGNTPVIGPVADMFRSDKNDSAVSSMMKTAAEDLLFSGIGYGALNAIDGAKSLRQRAPAPVQDPRWIENNPQAAAQARRILGRDLAELPEIAPPGSPAPAAPYVTPPYPRPDMEAPQPAPQPAPAAAAPVQAPPAVVPFSQPPAPKGGVIGRNADRLVGGAVGGFLGGGGDAFAAPGDGGGDNGNPLFGAGTGAVIGFLGPRAVASVGGRAWRSAARPFRGAGFDERVAARAFRKALAPGGITSVEDGLAAQPARFGDKPAPAYGFSQQATNLTAGLARLPGETADAARAQYDSLIEERAGRLERDLQQATGLSPATVTGDIKRLEQEAQAVAKPEYDALRSKYTTMTSDRLTKMTEESPTLAASVRAVEAHKAERLATKGEGMSDFEKWDLVKRDLDHKEQALIEQGVSLADLRVQNLDNARSELVAEMDRLIPNDEYAKARQLGGEAPRIRAAFAEGKGYIGGRDTPEEVLAKVSEWTGAPLTAAQSGALRTIMGKTDGAGAAIASLRTPKARKQIAAVFGQEAAANIDRRLAADAALVQNASRVNPNVGSATSQAGMGGGEGALAVAANLFRAGTNPLQTALAAMSKSGAYTQAQRDLMGQMAFDGMTRENLERIFRGQRPRTPRTPRPPRPAPAAPTAPPAPRSPLPGQTSNSPAFVGGAALGALGGAAANPDDPGKGAVLGAIGGGVVGYGAGKLAGGPKALPAPKPPKPPVPKAPVAAKDLSAEHAASEAAFENKASAIEKAGNFGDFTVSRGWKMPEGTLFEVRKGDNVVGTFVFEKRGWSDEYSIHADVQPEFQRQGVATAFYDHVENAIGQKLKPSGTQSPEGAAFTRSRQSPSSVTPLKPAPKPPTRQGMGVNASGAGAAGGGILGYALNPADANGDGVIDDLDRGLNGFGGMVSGGIAGKALGSRAAGKFGNQMKGPPKFRAPDAQTFGGVNAKTADRAALGRAQNMEAEGADRNAIWDATGWFKGVDGKWRFEIDDSASRMSDPAVSNIVQKGKTSGKVAGVLQHKALYEAYPELRDTDALVSSKPPKGVAYRGVWNPANGVFPRSGVAVETTQITGPNNARGILLHEMGGHGVQDIEGFATGGVPDTFKSSRYETDVWREAHRLANADEQSLLEMTEGAQKKYLAAARDNLYTRLAGETEARNVQTRRDFTPEQRRARPPWETQDVPDDQQIVRFGSGKAESRPKPPPNRLASGPQKGKPSTLIANTRATKPMATDISGVDFEMPKEKGDVGRVAVKTKDGSGEITFTINERGDYVVKESLLDADMRGQGLGIKMYEALAQRAAASRRAMYSDAVVSGDAVKMYIALKRRGYNVRLANPKEVWENPNYRPSTWDENKHVLFPAGPKSKPGTIVPAPSDPSVFKVTKYAALVGAGGSVMLVIDPDDTSKKRA